MASRILVLEAGGGQLCITTGADEIRILEVSSGDDFPVTNIKAINNATNVDKVRVWWSSKATTTETALFIPSDISGTVLWLRADQGITLSGSDVSDWLDLSGEGNDATQAIAGDRPSYLLSGGVSNLPGVQFTSADSEIMSCGTFVETSNDMTVFAVFNQTDLSGTQALFFHSGTSRAILTDRTDQISTFDDSISYRFAGNSQTGEQWVEWHCNSSTTTFTGYRNGSAIGSDTYSTTTWGLFTLGGASNKGSPFNGILSEVIVFNRILTASEITQIRNYLSNRYSL
jgi:hypothetical protein